MKGLVEGRPEVVVAADLPDAEWSELRMEHEAVRHRLGKALVTCVDCSHPLYPKEISRVRTRFFAHNPDAPEHCPLKALDGESSEHKRLKLAVYRAAKRTRGWDADLEQASPEVDPVTGRPVIVDVVARRSNAPAVPVAGAQSNLGWEIQLSGIDAGKVLERQEFRERWLERCTWVTSSHPAWADRLPWYQIAPRSELHGDLVVDGVVRWDLDDVGGGGEFVNEEPFPADQMVSYVLRGALWAQDVGWQLRPDARRGGRRRPRRETIRAVVAAYCDRIGQLPEYTRSWTDADWLRYVPLALDRREHGVKLGPLDLAAIARCPSLDLIDETSPVIPAYDHMSEVKPCLICREIVIVSSSVEFPIHHRCAWHVARGNG